MSSRLQATRRKSILVEAWPLFKGGLRSGLCFLGVPSEHFGSIFNPDAVAEALDDTGRVVEQVVSINDADFNTPVGCAVRPVCSIYTVSFPILDASIIRMAWSDKAKITDIIEEPAELIVSSFRNIEIVPPSDLVEGWDRASII